MSQNYKVYSITPKFPICPSHVYFGSTSLDVNTRFIKHRSSFKKERNYITSHLLFRVYGIDGCECVELHSGLTKDAARKKESEYILSNPCVNKCKNYITDLKQYHKDYRPIYYAANRDRLLAMSKRTFECACGVTIRRYYVDTHMKSAKHKKLSTLCIDCNAGGPTVSLQSSECGI